MSVHDLVLIWFNLRIRVRNWPPRWWRCIIRTGCILPFILRRANPNLNFLMVCTGWVRIHFDFIQESCTVLPRHHPPSNLKCMAPSSLFVFESETCYSLIFWLYRVLRNLLDAFFGLGIIFRVWEGQHRSGFVLGGYSVLHIFFEVLHGLKSDFTNDLYRVAFEFFVFEIGTGL